MLSSPPRRALAPPLCFIRPVLMNYFIIYPPLLRLPRVREVQFGGAAPPRVLLPTAARGRTSPGRATPSMRPSSWFRGPRRRSPLQVNRPWCRNCTERAVQSYSPGRLTCLVSPGGPLQAPGGPAQASAPSGWNDGLSAWCATSASRHKGSALSTTHRSLAAACSAARRRAAMGGAAAPLQDSY